MEAVIRAVKIAGMQAAIPKHRHSYVETPGIFTQEEADKLFASTGIHSRRILPKHLCASDMCIAAAESLLPKLGWSADSIDILIFVSQDSDYALPATACLIQKRLALASSAACFDVNLGCSGFIYASWIASQLMSGSTAKRALVLCGDTSSRHLMPDDRGTLPLFGDAGIAVAFEFDPEWSDSYAVFGTDGNGAQHIAVKAGGKRNPLVTSAELPSAEEQKIKFEQSRLHLNGAAVFSFTLKVVPKLVADVLSVAKMSIDDIDHVVMHQANQFILEHLRKKCGVAEDKYLIDMAEFGNTSSASIPLAMCHKLSDTLSSARQRYLLGGFGVGWSWGGLITEIGPIPTPAVIEIADDFPPLSLGA